LPRLLRSRQKLEPSSTPRHPLTGPCLTRLRRPLAARGEDLEAALVSPSTLVSAYRATTHFTPRDGVAEPYMAPAGRGVARPLSVDTPTGGQISLAHSPAVKPRTTP